ncbi:MAG: hypothetical protein QXS93_03215 [Candidatus Micrarchaeia archaeon]
MTSLMMVFTLSKFLRESFDLPVYILFEQLENAPGYKISKNGIVYQLMLCDTPMDNSTKLEIYMRSFKEFMGWLSNKSGVDYKIISYAEFQGMPFVRESLLRIFNDSQKFLPILNPGEANLRVRFPCNVCKFMDEDAKTLRIEELRRDLLKLSMECFDHGRYEINVTSSNTEFVDFNTPIRNAIKERLFVSDAKLSNALNVMVDGGDWVGMGELMNHVLGIWGYNASDLPTRIYTPIIEDWSGAKFSKSVYVERGTYDYLPPSLQVYPELMNTYGEGGLEVLWDEVNQWARNPKKLFRNYTVEYFGALFREKLGV